MSQRLVRDQHFMAMLPAEPDDNAGGVGTGTEGVGTVEDAAGEGQPAPAEDKPAPSSTYTAEEYEAVKTRMQNADRAKLAAEQKIREFEDKDRSELEKAQRDLAEVEQERDALKTQVSDLRIHNAFLVSNRYEWNNPQTALRLADLSEVTIGDDGKVVGLDAALEKLSKSDPYLLKPSEPEGDSGGTPTGGAVGSGKANDGKLDRKRLEDKYPALRR